MTVKHPEVRVRLARPANDFSILGDVIKALRAAGVEAEEMISFATRHWRRRNAIYYKYADSGSRWRPELIGTRGRPLLRQTRRGAG
jgi:hypothetical protein